MINFANLMTNYEIEQKQKQISKALQTSVHPDNLLAHIMMTRYRELETLKQKQ